jgi:hypothetical protein
MHERVGERKWPASHVNPYRPRDSRNDGEAEGRLRRRARGRGACPRLAISSTVSLSPAVSIRVTA